MVAHRDSTNPKKTPLSGSKTCHFTEAFANSEPRSDGFGKIRVMCSTDVSKLLPWWSSDSVVWAVSSELWTSTTLSLFGISFFEVLLTTTLLGTPPKSLLIFFIHSAWTSSVLVSFRRNPAWWLGCISQKKWRSLLIIYIINMDPKNSWSMLIPTHRCKSPSRNHGEVAFCHGVSSPACCSDRSPLLGVLSGYHHPRKKQAHIFLGFF